MDNFKVYTTFNGSTALLLENARKILRPSNWKLEPSLQGPPTH